MCCLDALGIAVTSGCVISVHVSLGPVKDSAAAFTVPRKLRTLLPHVDGVDRMLQLQYCYWRVSYLEAMISFPTLLIRTFLETYLLK